MNEIDLVIDGDRAFLDGKLEGIHTHAPDKERFFMWANTDIERQFIRNSYDKLTVLEGTGFTPKVLGPIRESDEGKSHETFIVLENLYPSEQVTDEKAFRRNCALLLWTLKKHNIRHGDITTKNIIVKNNKPMLIDFQQSKFDHEPGPDKRPEGDAHWLWKSALQLSPDTSRHIRKWQVIRPFIQGNSLVDFGCAEGDYLLFALTEKLSWDMGRFWGMDNNNNIPKYGNSALKKIWLDGVDLNHVDNVLWPVVCQDIIPYIGASIQSRSLNNAFFMSVFAHIARSISYNKAEYTLMRLVERSKQLFFETQLIGDGPGIHKTDDDVYNMLKQFGKVEKLVTIPVFGREPLARSVWRIT